MRRRTFFFTATNYKPKELHDELEKLLTFKIQESRLIWALFFGPLYKSLHGFCGPHSYACPTQHALAALCRRTRAESGTLSSGSCTTRSDRRCSLLALGRAAFCQKDPRLNSPAFLAAADAACCGV